MITDFVGRNSTQGKTERQRSIVDPSRDINRIVEVEPQIFFCVKGGGVIFPGSHGPSWEPILASHVSTVCIPTRSVGTRKYSTWEMPCFNKFNATYRIKFDH